MRARLRGTRRRVYVFLGVLALAGLIEAGVVLAGVGTQRASTTSRAHTPATAALPASSSHAATASSTLSASSSHVTVGHSVKNDTSPPLRSIRPVPMQPTPDHEANPNPQVPIKGMARPEAARQTRHFPNAMPGTGLNFDGIPFPGVACNCAPPDTNGEVGATQYVQIVNEGYQVFNKTTGASVLGPVSITTIWSGFGGVCQTERRRRPGRRLRPAREPLGRLPVRRRGHADRRVRRGLDHERRHRLVQPLRLPPRHELLRLPEALASGRTRTTWPRTSSTRAAPPISARSPSRSTASAMLAGTAATFVTTGLMSSSIGFILPGDLDGSIVPPAGAPEPVARRQQHGNVAAVSLPRRLRDAGELDLHAAPPACRRQRSPRSAPERATASRRLGSADGLDGLGDRGMFRLAYRRFGDGHEALVGNKYRLLGRRRRHPLVRDQQRDLRHADVRPAEHLPARHDLALDGQRGHGPGRRPGARLQRLERRDQPADPLCRPAGRRPARTRSPRVRRR